MDEHVLEPAAQRVAEIFAQPPFLFQMDVGAARTVLEEIQAAHDSDLTVDDRLVTVPTPHGDVQVRLVRPVNRPDPLPVVLFLHGGGWIFGDAQTHDRLVRDLCVGADAAVAFVEFDRSPEVRHPVALEQAYAAAQWIGRSGAAHGLDPARIAVAGDSTGGNMAAVLAILAKQRGDVSFVQQSLYYPATDAAQDTASYREFADGPYLTAARMAWFWDAYVPDVNRRGDVTVSPLAASPAELEGLPPALVIVDENDVLRDEGEHYARNLTAVGVPTVCVRYNGIVHDFLTLNDLRGTAAAIAAMEQATSALREAFADHRAS